MLDLTPIMSNPKAAIHLTTEEQAKQFYYYMVEHYPDKVANWPRGHEWGYKERQCYAPYFPSDAFMKQSSIDFYQKRGFDIVEFERLIPVKDLPIEHSDMSIDFMLGL